MKLKNSMRIPLYIAIGLLCLEQVWWLAIPLIIIYMYRYQSYELFVIALLLDGYVGSFYHIPYYSLVTVFTVIVAEWARPKIMLYTR